MKNLSEHAGKRQRNGPLATTRRKDRKSKRTRQKNKRNRNGESNDSPEIPNGEGEGGDIRHPRPPFKETT